MVRGTKKRLEKSITTKEKTPEKINIDLNMSIHNKFDIEVVDAATGKIKQKAVAYNTICDGLWSTFTSGYFKYIRVGSGQGTPSSTDTELFNEVFSASASNFKTSFNHKKGIYQQQASIILNTTQANGHYLSEVGIANSSTSLIATHAMFEDMNGNPITILKTETDIINIYATIYIHFPPEGFDEGSIWISAWKSSPYPFLSAIAGAGDNGLDLAGGLYSAFNFSKGGAGSSAYKLSRKYNSSEKLLSYTAPRLEYNQNNKPIMVLAFGEYNDPTYGSSTWYSASIHFIAGNNAFWFPKSTIIGESVGTGDGVTTAFTLKFPLAKNAKIYVNGVESTDAMVYYTPNSQELSPYVQYCRGLTDDGKLIKYFPPTAGFASTNNEAWTGTRYFYNPFYEYGIKAIGGDSGDYSLMCSLYASDDFENWYTVLEGISATSSSPATIPSQFRNKKYWKIDCSQADYSFGRDNVLTCATNDFAKAIHFTTPPPEGAIITADYDCDCIAKDGNHVFDFSFSVRLGEYTGDDV